MGSKHGGDDLIQQLRRLIEAHVRAAAEAHDTCRELMAHWHHHQAIAAMMQLMLVLRAKIEVA
jgi:hypothetical protein